MALHLGETIAAAGHKAALGAAGSLMVLAGAAFLTAALVILLVQMASILVALTVVGCAFIGAGLVTLAVTRGATPTQSHDTATADAPALVQAFFQGVKSGAAAQQGRR